MKDVNLAPSTAVKIKPISVKVHWSESYEFDENTHYDFMDFERKALEVAKTNPRGGYDKTKVTVLFDNEDTYECRLDLGCGGNDAGFASHCLNMGFHAGTAVFSDLRKISVR